LKGAAAFAAVAHFEDGPGQVAGGDPVFFEESQHQFKIGRDLQACIESTELFIYPFPDKEGRMRGMPSFCKGAGDKLLCLPEAQDLIRVGCLHVVEVGVEAVGPGFGHQVCHILQHMIIDVEIIGVEDADHIPGGLADALVHGIIEAIVGFRNDPGYAIGD